MIDRWGYTVVESGRLLELGVFGHRLGLLVLTGLLADRGAGTGLLTRLRRHSPHSVSRCFEPKVARFRVPDGKGPLARPVNPRRGLTLAETGVTPAERNPRREEKCESSC
jgi:hypothetical protein